MPRDQFVGSTVKSGVAKQVSNTFLSYVYDGGWLGSTLDFFSSSLLVNEINTMKQKQKETKTQLQRIEVKYSS